MWTCSFLITCGSKNHWRGNQSVRLRPLPHLPNRTLILFTRFPSSAWLCASEKPWRVGNHGVPLWLCDFWRRCLMKFWLLGPEEKFTDRNWVYGFWEGFLCCLKRCTWSGGLIFSSRYCWDLGTGWGTTWGRQSESRGGPWRRCWAAKLTNPRTCSSS